MTGQPITCQEFNSIYTTYRNKFCSIAKSYVRDATVADDIVDECFTNFWDNREKITLTDIPEAYILQSIKNKCLNHLRDKANHMRIHQQMQENAYRAMMMEIDFLVHDNMGILFENEVRNIFMNKLKTCPELSRKIFMASRFQNMTYDEIAAKYDISPRKVKREIQKMLEMLRKELKDYL